MNKHYYLVIDTETTRKGTVADFGAVLMDKRTGYISKKAIVAEELPQLDLFFKKDVSENDFWSAQNLPARRNYYRGMVKDGRRDVASVAAINNWLHEIKAKYDPLVTAYNFPFDRAACEKSGIDLSIFKDNFCLYKAARRHWNQCDEYHQWAARKNYKTDSHGSSFSADAVSHWVLGDDVPPEPHTAFEDAYYYEVPILKSLLRRYSRSALLDVCNLPLARVKAQSVFNKVSRLKK